MIRGEGAMKNRRYVVSSMLWSLATPKVRQKTEGESASTDLKVELDRKRQPKSVRAAWMSKAK